MLLNRKWLVFVICLIGFSRAYHVSDANPQDSELDHLLEAKGNDITLGDLLELLDVKEEIEAIPLKGDNLEALEEVIRRKVPEMAKKEEISHDLKLQREAEEYWSRVRNANRTKEASFEFIDYEKEQENNTTPFYFDLDLDHELDLNGPNGYYEQNGTAFGYTDSYAESTIPLNDSTQNESTTAPVETVTSDSTYEPISQENTTFSAYMESFTESTSSPEFDDDSTIIPAVSTTETLSFNFTQEPNVQVAKRLFKKSGSKGGSTLKSVMKSIGSSVKTGMKKVATVLKEMLKKLGEGIKKIKAKLSKALKRAKAIFEKAKGMKSLIFMKETVQTVWKHMPQEVTEMIYDKAVDMVLGGPGDIGAGLDGLDFDPLSLGDDDELAEMLGEDFMDDLDLGDEFSEMEQKHNKARKMEVEDGDLDIDDLEDELFDPEEKAVITGGESDLSGEVIKSRGHGDCCCLSVNGEKKPAEELTDEDLDKVDPESLELASGLDDIDLTLADLEGDTSGGVFNIEIDDFDAEALEAEPDTDEEELDNLEDMDYSDELGDDAFLDSLTKRSVKKTSLKKRSMQKRCMCSTKAIVKREIAAGRLAKKRGLKNRPPPLTSAIPVDGAVAMFKAGKLNVDNLCSMADIKAKKGDCVSIDGIRMGGIAGLLGTKILCPECDIKILSAGEKSANPFLKGWMFEIAHSDNLDVFISETFNTYDGQVEMYDQNKNRWTIKKNGENDENWTWEVLIHI